VAVAVVDALELLLEVAATDDRHVERHLPLQPA
jgi:hypothetical protein